MHSCPQASPESTTLLDPIRLEAVLGAPAAETLRQQLLARIAGEGSIRVDASAVEQVGASALAVLLAAAAGLRENGGRLIFEQPSTALREWVRLAGVSWLVD